MSGVSLACFISSVYAKRIHLLLLLINLLFIYSFIFIFYLFIYLFIPGIPNIPNSGFRVPNSEFRRSDFSNYLINLQ